MLDTYSIHHSETFIILPLLFIVYVYVLKSYSIYKRLYITVLLFCLSASLFGVLWWSVVPVVGGLTNVYFYTLLSMLSLIMVYLNNKSLRFFRFNKFIFVVVPLLIVSTYLRYFVPFNDYGWVWVFNRVMEFSVWFGFLNDLG